MRNETRKQFDAYLAQLAKLNGVNSAVQTFAVEPSVQQKLEQRIQESSEFLKQINVYGVDEPARREDRHRRQRHHRQPYRYHRRRCTQAA